jgi:hypothetical protein
MANNTSVHERAGPIRPAPLRAAHQRGGRRVTGLSVGVAPVSHQMDRIVIKSGERSAFELAARPVARITAIPLSGTSGTLFLARLAMSNLAKWRFRDSILELNAGVRLKYKARSCFVQSARNCHSSSVT